MAEMRVQGTNVFAFDGAEITQLVCVTSIDLGSDSTSKIETTCLEEKSSKSYIPGLSDPGDGSLSIKLDLKNSSHLKLIQWAQDRKELDFYIGASDGSTPPTVARNLPPSTIKSSLLAVNTGTLAVLLPSTVNTVNSLEGSTVSDLPA